MTSKELTFQPGKFTSTLATNQQQRKKKKKKAFGRRNNTTKVQSILASTNNNKNTNKRIPMEIGIKEKHNITPKDQQLVGTSTRQQNNINNNNTGISKGGMSSITQPTALKGGYLNIYSLAAAAAAKNDHHDTVINDGGELSFNEEEEYDTNNNTKKKNNVLASTRKRLSYGMGGEGVVSNNNKNNKALDKKKDHRSTSGKDKSKQAQKQGEQSKKRSRSGELRRMSKSAGQSTTATRKDGREKKRGETSIQQKTIITTKNPFTKKSQRTSSSYYAPLPTKKSIIVRTKSSSHNVLHIPSGSNNKLNQRELLKLAKSNNGTVIQYHATLHYGDSITDKNFSSSGSSNKLSSTNDYLIENGDLVIQQDCANVKGTYWTSKFGFRHWKLPGVRSSRGVSIYTSTRPILADDKGSGASDDKEKKRPLLTLDTSLSTQHDRLVRRFVKEARAGQTPFDFFPENELDDDKEGDDWQCKEEDEGDFGGGGDGFSFNDDGLAPSSDKSVKEEEEEEEEEDQRPAKRKAFGDRSNTVPQVHVPPPTQKTKTITKPRTKTARKKRKSSDTQATLPSTASSSSSSKKRPRTSIQFSVPSFGQEEEGGGYQDQVHWGLIEGMGGGEEESDNNSLPHRGRILEIPGVVMSGKWETNLLYDKVEEDEKDEGELNSLRLSLRHNTASSCSLETYYTGKEDSPNGLTVSLLDTSSNRVDDFVKQGVLSEDEVDFCVDGGKVTDDSFLSCLSLVTFGGFLSSSAVSTQSHITS